jgi:alpha-glucosidase
MNNSRFIIIVISALLGFSSAFGSPGKTEIVSPNGMVRCFLGISKDQVDITVALNGKTFLETSILEMSVDGFMITRGVREGKTTRFAEKEKYPVYGLHSTAVNNFNGLKAALTHITSNISYSIEVKVFNDAVAFRYIVPGYESSARKPDESTIFKLPSGSNVWYHDLYMHYEGIHIKKLTDTIPSGQWAAPPLTVKMAAGEGYISITEADLLNYAGMALRSDGNKGFAIRLGHSHPASYPYVLRYTKADAERLSEIAEVKGTISTPWRVVLIGKDLNTIVNSDAIHNLCPPPDKGLFPGGIKTDWIIPGRAVWRYLDGGGDNSLRNMKEFSRQAAELGFEYNILEGFWSRWPDDSLKSLVDYSKRLGVGIIVWKHSKDLRDPYARNLFFRHLHDFGVAGIKIDFFDHEAKELTDLYESIMKETAALKLCVIFHGSNKPTGLDRTYPNVLIYEGVKGMEASKLTDRATHETTLPFTRMLAGSADYSVCHFGARRQNTTWVHQVATAAIYSATVITYAANPANLLSNPCVEMIKSIPSVWDETIVLPPSEIGELAVFAQRKGKTWFLSVINGLQPKKIDITLTFLGEGIYETLILSDVKDNPAAADIKYATSGRKEQIAVELGPGGGYMTRFSLK